MIYSNKDINRQNAEMVRKDIANSTYAVTDSLNNLTWTVDINEKLNNYSQKCNESIDFIEVKGKDKNVVIAHFEDGDIQKAVCLPDDMTSFDIATGVIICIAKHCCGGSSTLHKLVKTTINNYYTEEYNKILKEKQNADDKIKAEKKAKKRKEYLENKRKKESEQRIEEIKEAILRATKEQITEYYEEGENE